MMGPDVLFQAFTKAWLGLKFDGWTVAVTGPSQGRTSVGETEHAAPSGSGAAPPKFSTTPARARKLSWLRLNALLNPVRSQLTSKGRMAKRGLTAMSSP